MGQYTRSELAAGAFVWLLRVEYASRAFLFASGSVPPGEAPTDSAGVVMAIDGTIGDNVGIDVSSDILSPGGSSRSVSFRGLIFPVDIAALVEGGNDLSTATGDLALWRLGDSYADRWRFLRGNVQRPEYGAKGAPVNLTIEENAYNDRSILPGKWSTVTAATFPGAGETVEGKYYPIIIGGPGVFRNLAGSDLTRPGSTAIVVGASPDTLLICGHEIENVTVKVYDGTTSEDFAPSITEDGIGNPVATVDISAASTISRTASSYTIYTPAGIAGGITGAGDVLDYFLRLSTLRIDEGKLAAAVPALNDYTIRGFTDSGGFSAWEWIQDNLIPLLPVSFVSSGGDNGGVYPIFWKLDAGPQDAIAEIVAGVGGATRDGPIRYDRNHRDVINEIRIDYAKNAQTGEYQRFQVLRPDAVALGSRPDVGSYHARISRNRYGSGSEAITTDIVYDDITAGLVLQWKIHALGFLHRVGVYIMPREWGRLGPGDVVTLTDSELSIVSRVCLVRSVAWVSASWVSVEVLILENPARDY